MINKSIFLIFISTQLLATQIPTTFSTDPEEHCDWLAQASSDFAKNQNTLAACCNTYEEATRRFAFLEKKLTMSTTNTKKRKQLEELVQGKSDWLFVLDHHLITKGIEAVVAIEVRNGSENCPFPITDLLCFLEPLRYVVDTQSQNPDFDETFMKSDVTVREIITSAVWYLEQIEKTKSH